MKKVRLTLKKDSSGWCMVLYDSPESAFFLKHEPMQSDSDEYRQLIELNPGETMEVEWCGSEWVYSGEPPYEKYDKVRMGKIIGADSAGRGGYVELYSGWVVGGHVRWSSRDPQNGPRITRVNGRVKSKLDFSSLFEDEPADFPEPAELN